jgi:hypothetical protein
MLLTSPNAALDELGGPKHFNHYACGWTWMINRKETY